MNITSTIYRGHEIVCMPSGACIVHKGDRTGPIVAQTPDEDAALAAVDAARSKPKLTEFRVHYMRPDWFRAGMCGEKPALATLDRTHALLRTVQARDLNDVYHQSQGEVWSPNGEARPMIRAAGLEHTSMSVGDVIENAETGEFHVVAMMGFDKLEISR